MRKRFFLQLVDCDLFDFEDVAYVVATVYVVLRRRRRFHGRCRVVGVGDGETVGVVVGMVERRSGGRAGSWRRRRHGRLVVAVLFAVGVGERVVGGGVLDDFDAEDSVARPGRQLFGEAHERLVEYREVQKD